MFTLYFFGSVIDAVYTGFWGKAGFYLFYLGGIIVSDIPSYIKNRHNQNYFSLGASGGVSAVVFAYILLAPWSWFDFPPLPAIVYGVLYLWYSAYMAKRQVDNIGHEAHFWGAIYGVVVTLLLDKKILSFFLEQLMNPQGPRWMN
jgi:membrane associated rhomboid family serine protease